MASIGRFVVHVDVDELSQGVFDSIACATVMLDEIAEDMPWRSHEIIELSKSLKGLSKRLFKLKEIGDGTTNTANADN